MTRKFYHATFVCWISLFAAAVPVAAAPKGQAIEFSEPRNERGLTNTPGLMPGRSRLDRIEAELNGPLKTILKGNSLEGMLMPAPPMIPPPVLQPRNRENTDRKRDQMYLTPEDLYSVKSIEDTYKAQEMTPDGRRVKDLRPMEKWVRQALNAGQPTNRAAAASMLENNYGVPGQESQNPADNLLRKELRKVFGLDAKPDLRDRGAQESSGFGDGFNQSSDAKLSADEFQRRESFMKNLDPNYVPAPAGSTVGGGGFSTPYVNSSFYDPPKAAPVVSASAISSTPGVTAVQPDLWKASFVQPAPVAKSEPAPAPVSPFMNAPRRSF